MLGAVMGCVAVTFKEPNTGQLLKVYYIYICMLLDSTGRQENYI